MTNNRRMATPNTHRGGEWEYLITIGLTLVVGAMLGAVITMGVMV